jgi:hypothetical protein
VAGPYASILPRPVRSSFKSSDQTPLDTTRSLVYTKHRGLIRPSERMSIRTIHIYYGPDVSLHLFPYNKDNLTLIVPLEPQFQPSPHERRARVRPLLALTIHLILPLSG